MNIHVQFGFNHICIAWLSEKKAFEHFPIGSNVNLCIAVAAIMGFRSRHFEFHVGTKNVKFVEDHPMNIHVQFGFNHICSF